jgi:hypothetical protein
MYTIDVHLLLLCREKLRLVASQQSSCSPACSSSSSCGSAHRVHGMASPQEEAHRQRYSSRQKQRPCYRSRRSSNSQWYGAATAEASEVLSGDASTNDEF